MFAKIPAVLAIFAFTAQVVVATPPACLLAAVNTQSDPSDIKSVCNDGASDVQKYLGSNCGDNLQAATSAFAETCKSAGVTISSSSATKSSTADDSSSTGTKQPSLSSATLTNGALSGFHTQTANSGAHSASATPTTSPASGAGSETSTGARTSQTSADVMTGGGARLGMDALGLVAIGLAGFMLAL